MKIKIVFEETDLKKAENKDLFISLGEAIENNYSFDDIFVLGLKEVAQRLEFAKEEKHYFN